MNIKLLCLVSALLFSQNITVAKKPVTSKKTCASLDKKIQQTNSKLRAGYSLKKGEALKNKSRKLAKQKYACQMKRYATN